MKYYTKDHLEKSNNIFDRYARHVSHLSMAMSTLSGAVILNILETYKPKTVIEVGMGFSTLLVSHWIFEDPQYFDHEHQEWLLINPDYIGVEHQLDFMNKIHGLTIDSTPIQNVYNYPAFYQAVFNECRKPVFAILDGWREHRVNVARHLAKHDLSDWICLIDDYQRSACKISGEILEKTNTGKLHNLKEFTTDGYGRYASLFIGNNIEPQAYI